MSKQWLVNSKLVHAHRFPNTYELTDSIRQQHPGIEYQFIDQSDERCAQAYYELVIDRQKLIPTRDTNWHDFFNAVIWHQFPKTKQTVSYFHALDIEKYGAHPRTTRRHQLTHFDECGLLLCYDRNRLDEIQPLFLAIATHDWHGAFVTCRELWHSSVKPVVFGHATLEMMLSPHLSMTAKWLAVPVENIKKLDTRQIDQSVCKILNGYQGLNSKQILRPLPIMGIPGWCKDQNDEFYKKTEYFRPQRENVPMTFQYPLKQNK